MWMKRISIVIAGLSLLAVLAGGMTLASMSAAEAGTTTGSTFICPINGELLACETCCPLSRDG